MSYKGIDRPFGGIVVNGETTIFHVSVAPSAAAAESKFISLSRPFLSF